MLFSTFFILGLRDKKERGPRESGKSDQQERGLCETSKQKEKDRRLREEKYNVPDPWPMQRAYNYK